VGDDLAGLYDVIARVQASYVDELSRRVVPRIQDVGGVLSCTVLDR
jgi:hypothetical protein